MPSYAGIDIGGSFIKYGIVDEKGNFSNQGKIPTNRKDAKQVLEDLIKIIHDLKQNAAIQQVGISIPGVIDRQNRLLTSGALVDFHKLDVAKVLSDATQTVVKLTNDAKAIAYGEQWLGAGKNCDNFVCLPLGTGVGGALVLDGKVVVGHNGAAGEIGMSLMGLGTKEPVGYESASFYCGAVAGLCRIYNLKKGNTDISTWQRDVKKILALAAAGESNAQESLNEFYRNTAVLLLNVRVTFDPEKILIGGGISENPQIMAGIKQAVSNLVARYTDMAALGFPIIEACQLGNTAGMIGAVSSFIEKGEK